MPKPADRFDELLDAAARCRRLAYEADSPKLRDLYLDLAGVYEDVTISVAAGHWMDWDGQRTAHTKRA